jgi:hypothetical protein
VRTRGSPSPARWCSRDATSRPADSLVSCWQLQSKGVRRQNISLHRHAGRTQKTQRARMQSSELIELISELDAEIICSGMRGRVLPAKLTSPVFSVCRQRSSVIPAESHLPSVRPPELRLACSRRRPWRRAWRPESQGQSSKSCAGKVGQKPRSLDADSLKHLPVVGHLSRQAFDPITMSALEITTDRACGLDEKRAYLLKNLGFSGIGENGLIFPSPRRDRMLICRTGDRPPVILSVDHG